MHSGRRVGEHGEPGFAEHLGPRVDQVQLDIVPGEDAGELQPDVPGTEDRHRGDGPQRLEQDGHLAAAALRAVLGRGALRQLAGHQLGHRGRVRQLRARSLDRDRLDVPAADRAPRAGRAHHHLRARPARRVAANRGEGYEYGGLAGRSEADDRVQPEPISHAPPRVASAPGGLMRRRSPRPARDPEGARPGKSLDHINTARVAGGLVARLLDRPEHCLGGSRAGQVHARAGLPEGRGRLAQRLTDRERQHQRRLPDRLGAVHGTRLGGVAQQRDVERLGHIG